MNSDIAHLRGKFTWILLAGVGQHLTGHKPAEVREVHVQCAGSTIEEKFDCYHSRSIGLHITHSPSVQSSL